MTPPRIQESEVPAPPAKRTAHDRVYLPVRYTHDERLDLAEQLARANQAKLDLEDQKKATDAEHKENVASIELSIRRLSRKLASGNEMRDVECRWIFEDPTPREKTLVRLDTGEVVRVVPMEERDFQVTLPASSQVIDQTPPADILVLEPPPVDGKSSAAAND